MTEEIDSLREDISFLRTLAEAGKERPLFGGFILAAAGLIFGTTALVSWLALDGVIHFGFSIGVLWLGALIMAAVGGFLVHLTTRGRSFATAGPSNLAFAMAWNGAGIGILVMAAVNVVAALKYHSPLVLVAQAPTIICLYGIAWFISSAFVRRWWFLGVAITSFAFAIALAALPYGAPQMLGFAIAIYGLVFVPGIYLMTRDSHS
jgi:hypothetical protein